MNDPAEKAGASLYEPLDMSQPSIRLLEINQLSNEDEVVECNLKTVSLDDHPKYIALSYMWGDTTDTLEIILNGRRTAVTRSLASALRDIRNVVLPLSRTCNGSQDVPSLLWADAICINQKDTRERNHQVRHMGAIFSGAAVVVSWPGTEIEDLSLAVTTLKIFAREMNDTMDSVEDIQWLKKYPSIIRDGGLFSTSREIKAVRGFFEAPYWRRAWVLQELVLAKEHWVLTSNFLMNQRVLMRLMRLIQWCHEGYLQRPDFIDRFTWNALGDVANVVLPATASLHETFEKNGIIPWEFMFAGLDFWTCRPATDPRDHVFAFQALCGNSIDPDYTKSVAEVYCSMTFKWIDSHLPLGNLLSLASEAESFKSPHGIPSWVPDWHRLSQQEEHLDPLALGVRYQVNKGLKRPSSLARVINHGCLLVSGCLCDTVTKVEPQYQPMEKAPHPFLQFCHDYSTERTGLQHPTGLPFLQVLIRTLLLDKPYENGGRSPQLHTFQTQRELIVALLAITYLVFTKTRLSDPISIKILGIRTEPLETLLPEIFGRLLPGIPIHPDWWQIEDRSTIVDSEEDLWRVYARIRAYLRGRLFHTNEGYLGIGPVGIQPGDSLCVLSQCEVPVVLRKIDAHYVLVGVCFVLGFMYGETAQLVEDGKLEIQEFEIH